VRQIAVLGILVVMRMRGVSSRAQTMQEMSAMMRIIATSDEEKDDEQTGERDEPIDEFCV